LQVWAINLARGYFEKAVFSRLTDLFGDTEFVVPDVLFKTTNARAPKKRRGYPDRYPSRGLVAGLKK